MPTGEHPIEAAISEFRERLGKIESEWVVECVSTSGDWCWNKVGDSYLKTITIQITPKKAGGE